MEALTGLQRVLLELVDQKQLSPQSNIVHRLALSDQSHSSVPGFIPMAARLAMKQAGCQASEPRVLCHDDAWEGALTEVDLLRHEPRAITEQIGVQLRSGFLQVSST